MKDLTGKKFNRLLVVEYIGTRVVGKNTKRSYWLCKCDCGNLISVTQNNLNRSTKSCGCLKKEKTSKLGKEKVGNIQHLGTIASTKHGLRNTRIYNIWHGMKKRCLNPKDAAFKRYGGRGITICDEWKNNVKSFYDWAIANGYNDTLTIDRVDNDGNYEPNNCEWVTPSENSKRRHRIWKQVISKRN